MSAHESSGSTRGRAAERRAILAGAAALGLTSIHHVYGAVLYGTPERYHAVVIAAVSLGAILGGHALAGRAAVPAVRGAGRWISRGVNAVFVVVLFGAFEGFYNHVVKVALYLGGLPPGPMRALYPAPTYEMPNDVIFEATGILQVVPSALAGFYLARLLAGRSGRPAAGTPRSSPGPPRPSSGPRSSSGVESSVSG